MNSNVLSLLTIQSDLLLVNSPQVQIQTLCNSKFRNVSKLIHFRNAFGTGTCVLNSAFSRCCCEKYISRMHSVPVHVFWILHSPGAAVRNTFPECIRYRYMYSEFCILQVLLWEIHFPNALGTGTCILNSAFSRCCCEKCVSFLALGYQQDLFAKCQNVFLWGWFIRIPVMLEQNLENLFRDCSLSMTPCHSVSLRIPLYSNDNFFLCCSTILESEHEKGKHHLLQVMLYCKWDLIDVCYHICSATDIYSSSAFGHDQSDPQSVVMTNQTLNPWSWPIRPSVRGTRQSW
jgi:hypothetical protein